MAIFEVFEKTKVIDCKAEAEAFDASPDAVPLTHIEQTDDCMGDALRGQGAEPNQLRLTLTPTAFW